MDQAGGLSDGAVVLRAPTEADVDAITAACQDPEIQRWTALPTPYVKDDAAKWVTITHSERAAGSGFHFLVVKAQDERLLGAVGMHVRRNTANEVFAKAGYWVAAPERGHGVAARALQLLADWALVTLDVRWVELSIDPANERSRAVALRCGFELDQRSPERFRGHMVELDRYRLTARASSA